jgi:hypothetical protein
MGSREQRLSNTTGADIGVVPHSVNSIAKTFLGSLLLRPSVRLIDVPGLYVTFGLARSLPVVLIGTIAGLLARFPHTGTFTHLIERISGVLLLAAAAYFFYQAAIYAGLLASLTSAPLGSLCSNRPNNAGTGYRAAKASVRGRSPAPVTEQRMNLNASTDAPAIWATQSTATIWTTRGDTAQPSAINTTPAATRRRLPIVASTHGAWAAVRSDTVVMCQRRSTAM